MAQQAFFGADVGASGQVKAALRQGTAVEGPHEFAAAGSPTLAPVLADAARKLAAGRPLARGCVAVAGRVRDGACRLTHVDWPDVAERTLSAELGFPVRLVNDLEAHVRAAASLYLPGEGLVPPAARQTLHARRDAGPVLRVVAVGMGAGLGVGRAYRRGEAERFTLLDSEGGHFPFGPQTPAQDDLLAYLRARVGATVTYEHVLSGRAPRLVYGFLRDEHPEAESAAVREALAVPGADVAAVISDAARRGDALSGMTLSLMAEVAAQYAAAVALHENADVVAFSGGVAQKNVQWLRPRVFERAFRAHGLKAAQLADVEVILLTERYTAVLGALALAQEGS